MNEDTFVGAIDQGTTGTRFMIFDGSGRIVSSAYRTHEQRYPEPGWVEHDPDEIWENTVSVIEEAVVESVVEAADLAAIGITNQRETTVVWDADSGEPVHDAIVWQDRRTTDRVEALEDDGEGGWIRDRTGLQLDPYFSATKLEWLLDADERGDLDGAHVDGEGHIDGERTLRERARNGEVLFGTIDAWLRYRLTGTHATDVTNASRTMLFDVDSLSWDDELCALFDVPTEMLPEVRPSIEASPFDTTDVEGTFDVNVPVAATLGDQQAALFGQRCFDAGDAKNTYGTGSFFLMNTGTEPVTSAHGLLTTVAYQRAGELPRYALEGSIFVTGAAIEWLADVGLIDAPSDTERLAASVDETDDVFVVPAFSGLGAPHWDGRARGTIVGLTRGTRREHIVRATLEAIAFRTRDVAAAMEADSGIDMTHLRVDGGSVTNDTLCQLQADVVGTDIVRPAVDETTALGAATAAGLAVGAWDSLDALREDRRIDRTFEPVMDRPTADARYERWGEAVDRSRDWAREEA